MNNLGNENFDSNINDCEDNDHDIDDDCSVNSDPNFNSSHVNTSHGFLYEQPVEYKSFEILNYATNVYEKN